MKTNFQVKVGSVFVRVDADLTVPDGFRIVDHGRKPGRGCFFWSLCVESAADPIAECWPFQAKDELDAYLREEAEMVEKSRELQRRYAAALKARER